MDKRDDQREKEEQEREQPRVEKPNKSLSVKTGLKAGGGYSWAGQQS